MASYYSATSSQLFEKENKKNQLLPIVLKKQSYKLPWTACCFRSAADSAAAATLKTIVIFQPEEKESGCSDVLQPSCQTTRTANYIWPYSPFESCPAATMQYMYHFGPSLNAYTSILSVLLLTCFFSFCKALWLVYFFVFFCAKCRGLKIH